MSRAVSWAEIATVPPAHSSTPRPTLGTPKTLYSPLARLEPKLHTLKRQTTEQKTKTNTAEDSPVVAKSRMLTRSRSLDRELVTADLSKKIEPKVKKNLTGAKNVSKKTEVTAVKALSQEFGTSGQNYEEYPPLVPILEMSGVSVADSMSQPDSSQTAAAGPSSQAGPVMTVNGTGPSAKTLETSAPQSNGIAVPLFCSDTSSVHRESEQTLVGSKLLDVLLEA